MPENNKMEVIGRLKSQLGISYDDARLLRNISMTLHRWHEMECGVDGGCIERDEVTQKTYWRDSMTGERRPHPDKETGAIKRLQEIIAKYPNLTYYIQGDPRGCALYILTPADVPQGESIDSYYNRGVPVYK